MKNTLKKVLLGLGISLMLFGCGVAKRQQERNDYPLGTSMKISCNIENARQYQVDSLMVLQLFCNLLLTACILSNNSCFEIL